jgi:membrane peptidoglycan carboxypeptidase
MGYCQTRRPHDKVLSKLEKESPGKLGGFMVLVGKPFFLLLLITVEILISISYLFSSGPAKQNRVINHKTIFIKILPLFFFFSLFYFYILKDLPSPKKLLTDPPKLASKIYDRNGILLYQIYKDENRSLISLNDIPKHALLATLAIEDNEFYKHPGFSLKGIMRAVFKNINEGKMYGGSTITQQLVKNTLLTREKNLQRKIKELILAIGVELMYSKNEILEMYLNVSPYGGTVYGIKEAAKSYFGKEVSDLTLAESAFLAGIPKSPNNYSPFIGDPNSALSRQKEVLGLMLENGYIKKSEYDMALSEKLNFAENKIKIKAPHFVMFVKDYLEKTYGESMVSGGGLDVITTLDSKIQSMAEAVVADELSKLKNYKVTNASVIITNPRTGEILTMIGSNNYFDLLNDGNVNAIFSLRPPGSSIKVVNYAYALSNGYTPASIIDDTPVRYKVAGSSDYVPVNYDKSFKGKISLRSALAQSRNVPAVKVLSSYGVSKMVEMGKKMGIASWDKSEYFGLSMTLGGANTTLFDLAQVYGVIANYGIKKPINPIINIKNSNNSSIADNACSGKSTASRLDFPPTIANSNKNGDILTDIFGNSLVSLSYASYSEDNNGKKEKECVGENILDPRVAYIITDILRDNNARAPTFGLNSQLNVKNHKEVAVKTGTSNSMRDNIAIGYSQDYLVAVWVGNNDNSPMSNIASGITGATPIFNEIMSNLLLNKESVEWDIPPGLVKKPVCLYSKKKDSEEVSLYKYNEWFLNENIPKNICQNPIVIDAKVKNNKQSFRGLFNYLLATIPS